jgi:hypothetical protein
MKSVSVPMIDLLTPPVPLFSKTRKGGDLHFKSLALKVTLFKIDEGGFREGRGESVKWSLPSPHCA